MCLGRLAGNNVKNGSKEQFEDIGADRPTSSLRNTATLTAIYKQVKEKENKKTGGSLL